MALSAKEKKEKAALEAKAVSLCPEDMTEGGGLLDNIRATITDAKFENTNYGGKSKMLRPAGWLQLEEPDGESHDDQWWSVGKAEDWTPSDDGTLLLPTGVKTAIHKSSNLGMLMQSALDAGFPAEKMTADITFLVGVDAHWQQVVIPGRDKVQGKDGKEFDPTCLCISEIFTFPWEKKSKGKGKSSAKSKGKSTKSDTAPDAALEDTAAEMVMEIVLEAGGEDVAKKTLGTAIMQKCKASDDISATIMNQLVKLAFRDDFLGHEDRPWDYEDGVLTMGE